MANSVDPTLIDPVTINILIVADGRLRFDVGTGKDDDYSFSLMIEGLHQTAGSVVRFSTTTAYRPPKEHIRKPGDPSGPDSNGEGADIASFRFECKDITENYDEVWIFGDQSETIKDGKPEKITTQLTPCELCALQEFMDNGGGVFASGDHESLGASINAYVPRVRVMRTWREGPGTGGTGQPDQNDTRVGFEIDDTPQKITPILFSGRPHPLLDGPRGMIEVLPDHVHEGICRDSFSATDLEEFPGNGSHMPLAIALSQRHDAPPATFPAICAYDGHPANVGRVVVDASFHHFVKVNLKQFLPKPTSSPQGTATNAKTGVYAYEDIKSYHKNIAIWLARPEKQREMFLRALWEVRWRSGASGVVSPATAINPSDPQLSANANAILRLGNAANDALGRLTSPSFTLLWSIESFSPFVAGDDVFAGLYPWLPANAAKPNPPPNPAAPPSKDAIAFMIGGVMMAMAARFPRRSEEGIRNFTQELQDILQRGVQIGRDALEAAQ